MVSQQKKVKFVDLYKINKPFKKKILKNIAEIIDNSDFINGKYVKKFEKAFANINKIKYCQSCANGTDALYVSLKALNVSIGDEVILSAHDWISSSEAVLACGAKPVFIDIKKNSFLIDENKIEESITHKTKAIIIVHIYGQVVDLSKIINIVKKYNIKIIEDCAQAHLANYKKKYVGTIGDIGCFSFFPTKNLGAFGDAGAIITKDFKIYKKIKMICNHGGLKKNQHLIKGINSRMDTIQASILLEKLKLLKKGNKIRRTKAKFYINLFKKIRNVTILEETNIDQDHVYHLFVLLVKNRNELRQHLKKSGIQNLVHYPKPIPFIPVNKSLNHKSHNFKNVNKLKKQIISIPFHPNISYFEMKKTASMIFKFYQND